MQYGRDSDNRAHQRIYAELYTIDVDAGKTGRLLVGADREHVAAEHGLLRDDVQHERDEEPIEDRHKHLAADLHTGNLLETRRNLRRTGLHELLRHAAQDLHGTERCDERRNLARSDHEAVEAAENDAGRDGDQNGNYVRRCAGKADRAEPTAVCGVDKRHGNGADRDERGADGKINAAGDDDERHAERDDTNAGVVTENVHPVVNPCAEPFAEACIVEAERERLQNDHDDQCNACGKQRIILPIIAEPCAKALFVCFFVHYTCPPVARRMMACSFISSPTSSPCTLPWNITTVRSHTRIISWASLESTMTATPASASFRIIS